MKNLLFISILFTFLFINCGENATETEPFDESGVIMPLKINNTWIYEVATHITSNPDSIFRKATMTRSVDSIVSINDTEWYVFNDVFQFESDLTSVTYTTEFVKNRDDGLWATTPFIPGLELLVRKYPTQKGDTFGLGQGTTFDTDVEIQTNIGEFQCIQYKFYDSEVPNKLKYSYYSPNIGMILESRSHVGKDTVITITKLVDYGLN